MVERLDQPDALPAISEAFSIAAGNRPGYPAWVESELAQRIEETLADLVGSREAWTSLAQRLNTTDGRFIRPPEATICFSH